MRSELNDSSSRRLVSILLATPDTAIFESLNNNFCYFDTRSGLMWDLYVAGYYAYGRHEYDTTGFPVAVIGAEHSHWWFSPKYFTELHLNIASEHSACLAQVPLLRGRRTSWKYSGLPELVNLWVTGTDPDWESLVSQPLSEDSKSLSAVVETHSSWETSLLPDGFQPGTRDRQMAEVLHVDTLRRGLKWAVAGAAGAALTEGVNALIEALSHH